MTQECDTQRGRQATANHDRNELTDDELALAAGGGGGTVDPSGNVTKASPQLF